MLYAPAGSFYIRFATIVIHRGAVRARNFSVVRDCLWRRSRRARTGGFTQSENTIPGRYQMHKPVCVLSRFVPQTSIDFPLPSR